MRGYLSRLPKTDLGFFSILFLYTIFIFRKAFSAHYFQDDFFFIKVSQVENLKEFLYFFYPFKEYFFRPVATEVFYYTLSLVNYNLLVGHLIVFGVLFTGLIFLFKSIFFLTKSKPFSYLVVFMYSISLTHVFQLYWFATFQEVCLFSFLTISFYFFLKNRYLISLPFFLLALLSKETAIFFPFVLIFYAYYRHKLELRKYFPVIFFFLISAFFLLIYSAGVSSVEQIEIYKIQLNPKLIVNNISWYFLWSLGFPNFLPNYVKSIFLQPLPDFWNLMKADSIRTYMYFLSSYLVIFTSTLAFYLYINKGQSKRIIKLALVSFFFFLLFLSPTLPIIHKWMVRLTIPFIFLTIIQSYLIYLFYKSKNKVLSFLSLILVLSYSLFNILGVKVHESSGLFELENQTVINAQRIFFQRKDEIIEKGIIYFSEDDSQSWGGTKRLKNTLHNQDFITYYFPNKPIKAIYGFENFKPPENAVIIKAGEFFR